MQRRASEFENYVVRQRLERQVVNRYRELIATIRNEPSLTLPLDPAAHRALRLYRRTSVARQG